MAMMMLMVVMITFLQYLKANKVSAVSPDCEIRIHTSSLKIMAEGIDCAYLYMTRNQINDTFLFQNTVKVKVVGEVSEQ